MHEPIILHQGRNRYSVDSKKSKLGLLDISVTEKDIYFIYSEETFNEALANNYVGANEILCFDWSGNKRKKYITPMKISKIAASEEYIYGIHYDIDTGNTLLLRFKI